MEQSFEYGRKKLAKETDISAIIKSLRYLTVSMRTLIPKETRERLKLRTRYYHIKPATESNTISRRGLNMLEDFHEDLTDGFESDLSILSEEGTHQLAQEGNRAS